MTKRIYRGDAPDIAQITRIPEPSGAWSDPIRVGISNKLLEFASWDPEAIAAAWNAAPSPELRAVQAAPAGSDLQLTARTAGVPFEPIANFTSDLDEVRRSRGKWHFDDPVNWRDVSGGDDAVPNTGDECIYESGRISCLYGLRQSATFAGDSSTDELILDQRADFSPGQLVMVRSTGVLPDGLDSTDVYEIASYNRFSGRMALLLDSTPVDLEDAGTGTHEVRLALEGLHIAALYSGQIGLPNWHPAGYQESLPTALHVGIDPLGSRRVVIGQGTGPGSTRIKLDFGGDSLALEVFRTSNPAELGVPAAVISGRNRLSTVDIYGGEVGLGFFQGQEFGFQRFTLHSGNVSYGRLVSAEDADLSNLGGNLDGRELEFTGRVRIRR